jgi:hypothetical protein
MVKSQKQRGERDGETGGIEGNRGAARGAGQDNENRDAEEDANAAKARDRRHRA